MLLEIYKTCQPYDVISTSSRKQIWGMRPQMLYDHIGLSAVVDTTSGVVCMEVIDCLINFKYCCFARASLFKYVINYQNDQ